MKERIVITNDVNQNKMREQIPETFEELKELCKDIKEVKIEVSWIELRNTDGIPFIFYSKGYVGRTNDVSFVAKNRTPAQMWQIIKSLTEN